MAAKYLYDTLSAEQEAVVMVAVGTVADWDLQNFGCKVV